MRAWLGEDGLGLGDLRNGPARGVDQVGLDHDQGAALV